MGCTGITFYSAGISLAYVFLFQLPLVAYYSWRKNEFKAILSAAVIGSLLFEIFVLLPRVFPRFPPGLPVYVFYFLIIVGLFGIVLGFALPLHYFSNGRLSKTDCAKMGVVMAAYGFFITGMTTFLGMLC